MADNRREKELFGLKQEEEYRRQIYSQHKHNLQDTYDNTTNLQSYMITFQQLIDATIEEESLEQALNSSLLSGVVTSSSVLSNSSTVSQSPLRRSFESFPAFGTPIQTKTTSEKLSDWKVEGGVTLFDVLSGRSNVHRGAKERAGAFKSRLLKRLAHLRYLEAQLQEELEEKALLAKQALEQVRTTVISNINTVIVS